MEKAEGKIVLITGGASGIGRLMALDFAERGAKVVVWDLDASALESFVTEGKRQKLQIIGMVCDIADRQMVYARADELRATVGEVDILVNNAGVVYGKPFLELSDEKIEKTMAVNCIASFWTVKAFLPSMLERDSGQLVTIASAAGIIGVLGLADYSASKFAAFGFHEALRMEIKRRGSKVKSTVVCPFFIDTGMFDGVKTRFPLLLPILKAEKAAKRIVKATLKGKKRLLMPPMVYTVYLLRLLPVSAFDAIANFFGINHSMDHFTGRKNA